MTPETEHALRKALASIKARGCSQLAHQCVATIPASHLQRLYAMPRPSLDNRLDLTRLNDAERMLLDE